MERVPEHSIPLMTAMANGKTMTIESYQFYHGQDWLMAIAYPLSGKYSDRNFESALEKALDISGASQCHAIGAQLPISLQPYVISRDRYYALSSEASLPARLKGVVKNAASRYHISESAKFSPDHRMLWNEFLDSKGSGGEMSQRVRELYLRTPAALALCDGSLRLLDARNEDGSLVASLLLDYAPSFFMSYILGVHSRKISCPHAMDLLFWTMIQNARKERKRYIHLGLGVNDGILRFKLKWGAKAYLPYQMASWDLAPEERRIETASPEAGGSLVRDMAFALLQGTDKSARQLLEEMPEKRPFAMIWEVEKDNRISWVSGTAHFFCKSFETSFRKLYKNVKNVIFEGPLDNGFMEQVEEAGKSLPPGKKPLLADLTELDVKKLEKAVFGSRNIFTGGKAMRPGLDIRYILRTGNYWYAFFTLWTKFLERQGWKESVDMEAWRIASQMDLNIVGMETLDEQLESLGSLPRERVINFFRNCGQWKAYANRNKRAYLAGDLEKMMGTSAEFPTRTEHVVGRRDQRFRERMRPWLEEGNCAVFVGCAHMVNLRNMLREDGFRVRQRPFGLWPKIHLGWRHIKRPDDKVGW